MKLKDWLDYWTKSQLKYNIKQRSYISYTAIIEKHLKPNLGNYDLDELSPSVLQNFVTHLLENGNLRTGGKLSNNSVILIVNVLKQAIKEANLLEITTKDYCNRIKMPDMEESHISSFEKWEQLKIEKYCLNNKKNYIGIVICLYTGLRIGELLALTWKDIDFGKNTISITKSAYQGKIDGKTQIVISTPKTKNSNRIIPIPKQLSIILRKIKKKSTSLYIITTNDNQMIGTRSYQRTFERLLRRLNIKKRNFHSLRHTFATRALEFGIDVKTVSDILGHKNPMITLQRYTHSLMSYKRIMMNKFGKFLEVS